MKRSKTGSSGYLFAVSLVAALGGFLFGFDTAVISGTVGFVKQQFALDAVTEGWFVGSALLGCILGVSFAGTLADFMGRKFVLFLSALLFAVSAAGCTVSPTIVSLVVYRLIGGMGVGVASMTSPLYISEISPPDKRGRLVALYQFAITIGILVAYFSNARLLYLSQNAGALTDWPMIRWVLVDQVWRIMFGAEIVPAMVFFILLFFVPASPRWLTAKNREDRAFAVLTRVAGKDTAAGEIADIKETLKRETGSIKELMAPGFRVALLIGMGLAILSQLTGINAIIYYGPRIFAQAGFGVGDSLKGQVVIGVINVLFTLIALWKIDRLGRRPLLMAGVSGMFISLLLVGLFFHLQLQNGIWLLVFMLAFIACFAFSFGPVVWTVLSEIYPTYIRGRAMSIATFVLWVGTWLIGQLVPWFLENIGAPGTFWLFALMCVPAFLIAWKLLPETKGLTLEEIERHWLR